MVTAEQDHGTAKRLRHSAPVVTHVVRMTTVTCDKCGDEFAIAHRAEFQDTELAIRQAAWLADRLVWDHIQETKHTGSVRLPYLAAGSH